MTSRSVAQLLLLSILAAVPADAGVVIVNSTEDSFLDDGRCTLREAIDCVNHNSSGGGCVNDLAPGAARIEFDLPGPGAHTIALASPLEWITTPVYIDGLTQPGASCASWPPKLLVELDGSAAGPGAYGLVLFAPGSTVRGLVVRGFAQDGIFLSGAHSSRVQCNFVGTNAAGTLAAPNRSGIVFDQVRDSSIGTDGDGLNDAAERNLVSGNRQANILFSGEELRGNRVSGNLVGTDVTGRRSLANGGQGIAVLHGTDNVLGTDGDGVSDALEGNVISGHAGHEAVYVHGNESARVRIAGNRIGTDLDGAEPIPNGLGIQLYLNVEESSIGTNSDGVSDALEGNLVAYSQGAGIAFDTTHKNRIQGNRIFGNGGPGIELYGNDTDNRIGTDGDGIRDTLEGNWISGNLGPGISIAWSSPGTRIAGNSIEGNGRRGVDVAFDGERP